MRPDAQLFLHIVGATALFGSLLTVAALGLVGRRQAEPTSFADASLVTTLGFGVPAWLLMFIFGSWTKSKEGLPNSVDWVKQPVSIAVVGIFVLVACAGVAFSWKRRPLSSVAAPHARAAHARLHGRARSGLVDDDRQGGVLSTGARLTNLLPPGGEFEHERGIGSRT